MRFNCHFLNHKTDERRSLVIGLSDRERESVESLRRREGTDAADLSAMCYALHHAYRELDPHTWHHIEAPKFIVPS